MVASTCSTSGIWARSKTLALANDSCFLRMSDPRMPPCNSRSGRKSARQRTAGIGSQPQAPSQGRPSACNRSRRCRHVPNRK
eukprot:6563631-Alexandrium_andersonii.AAC.1